MGGREFRRIREGAAAAEGKREAGGIEAGREGWGEGSVVERQRVGWGGKEI